MLFGHWGVWNDKINGVCLLVTGNHGSFDRSNAHSHMEEEVLRRKLGSYCDPASLKL